MDFKEQMRRPNLRHPSSKEGSHAAADRLNPHQLLKNNLRFASNRRKQRSPAEAPSHTDWQSWTECKWHISEKSIKCCWGLCGDWNCTIFKETSTAGGEIGRDKWCRVSPKHSNHLNPPTVPDDSLNRVHKHQFYKSKHFQLYRQLQDDITLKCSTVK